MIIQSKDIKEARELLGRSKLAMARLLKVSYPTYCSWEKGEHTPSPKFRGALQKVIELADLRRPREEG